MIFIAASALLGGILSAVVAAYFLSGVIAILLGAFGGSLAALVAAGLLAWRRVPERESKMTASRLIR